MLAQGKMRRTSGRDAHWPGSWTTQPCSGRGNGGGDCLTLQNRHHPREHDGGHEYATFAHAHACVRAFPRVHGKTAPQPAGFAAVEPSSSKQETIFSWT